MTRNGRRQALSARAGGRTRQIMGAGLGRRRILLRLISSSGGDRRSARGHSSSLIARSSRSRLMLVPRSPGLAHSSKLSAAAAAAAAAAPAQQQAPELPPRPGRPGHHCSPSSSLPLSLSKLRRQAARTASEGGGCARGGQACGGSGAAFPQGSLPYAPRSITCSHFALPDSRLPA